MVDRAKCQHIRNSQSYKRSVFLKLLRIFGLPTFEAEEEKKKLPICLFCTRFQRSLVNIRGLKTVNNPSYYSNMPSETATLHLNIVRSKLLEDCINIFTEV